MSDTNGLQQQGQALAVQVNAIHVVDQASLEAAVDFRRGIRGYLKKVDDLLGPIIESAHKAHKVALGQKKSLEAAAQGADRILKERIDVYERAERQKAEAAELAARAEQERLEQEAVAAAARETARLREAAQERILAEAMEHEAAGDTASADFLLEEPVYVPTVMPAPVFVPRPMVTAPKVDGLSFRDNWTGDFIDLFALAQAVVTGRAPLSLLAGDQTALNAYARSTRGTMQIPGVKFVNKRVQNITA